MVRPREPDGATAIPATAVSRPCPEMPEPPLASRVGEQLLCRLRAALNFFPEGSLVRERPGGKGGMGLHMPNRPDAAPGIPKSRVAPDHGPKTRIGTGDPRAVAQLQAVRRLAEPAFRTCGRDFPCTSTPMSNSHLWIGNGLPRIALNPDVWECGSRIE